MSNFRTLIFASFVLIAIVVSAGGNDEKNNLLVSKNPGLVTNPTHGSLIPASQMVLEEIPRANIIEPTQQQKKKKKVGFFTKIGMLIGCVPGESATIDAPKPKQKPVVNQQLNEQRLLKFATTDSKSQLQIQKLIVDPQVNKEGLMLQTEDDQDQNLFFSQLGKKKAKSAKLKKVTLKEKRKMLNDRLKKLSLAEKIALTKHHESCGKAIQVKLNEFRQSKGLRPLQWSQEIYNAILDHTQGMAVSVDVSHDKFKDRFAKIKGIKKGAENVGMSGKPAKTDQEVADVLMDGWKNSDGHRKNMLINPLTHVAIDCVYSEIDNAWYSTMFLATL